MTENYLPEVEEVAEEVLDLSIVVHVVALRYPPVPRNLTSPT